MIGAAALLFQFTRPHWGATMNKVEPEAEPLFQFTRPHWGATESSLAQVPARVQRGGSANPDRKGNHWFDCQGTEMSQPVEIGAVADSAKGPGTICGLGVRGALEK